MDYGQQHLTDQQAEHFRQRMMTADERRRWEIHIAGCQTCLDQVYGGKNSALAHGRLAEALVSSPDEEFHLSMQELQRYAGGFMDEADRVIFESHLEGCPACRSRAELGAIASSSASVAKEFRPKSPSFWQGLASLWRRPGFALSARLAIGVVLLACIPLGWKMWHRRNLEQINRTAAGDSVIVVQLEDGNSEITLDKDGKLAGLEGLDPVARSAVREALMTAGLTKPGVLDDLSGPAIKLMGPAGNSPPFALISPVDTVVAEEQPTLRWNPLRGATGYTVAVFDPQFRLVTKSPLQPGTEWSVPKPLHRGTTYSWQVTARVDNRQITVPVAPAPRVQFLVLDAQSAEDLKKATVPAANSHLALGILYARAGLQDNAESEFEALSKENPQSPVASKLLGDVRSWRH